MLGCHAADCRSLCGGHIVSACSARMHDVEHQVELASSAGPATSAADVDTIQGCTTLPDWPVLLVSRTACALRFLVHVWCGVQVDE